ncbi:MAG: DEAD/DEAH box helicase [Spirochaetes bacterium]|nr:DEAD/DEAH box helicase [Spirochaetota bacterium]
MVIIEIHPKDAEAITRDRLVIEVIKKATSFYSQNYERTDAYQLYLMTNGKRGWDGKRRLYRTTRDGVVFPAGLASRVIRRLKAKGIAVDLQSPFNSPGLSLWPAFAASVKLNGIEELRPYQKRALLACLEKGRGVLDLATNAGKTEVAASLIQALGHPQTLWVCCGTVKLARQTRERLETRLDLPVGIAGGGELEFGSIVVGMPRTLQTKPEVQPFMDEAELVIIDECHHAASKTVSDVLKRCSNAYRRIGLSGTPFKRQDNQNIVVEGLIGPTICKVTNDYLIKGGYSANPFVFIHTINEPVISGSSWGAVYKGGIVNNSLRNEMIIDLALEKASKGEKTLITVFEIEQGKNLCRSLRKKDAVEYGYGFIYGDQDPATQDQLQHYFENGDILILIASPVLGEGIDFDTAIDNLIVGDAKKAPIALIQRAGRALRKGSRRLEIHDFADCTDDNLATHSMSRIKTYEGQKFLVEVL